MSPWVVLLMAWNIKKSFMLLNGLLNKQIYKHFYAASLLTQDLQAGFVVNNYQEIFLTSAFKLLFEDITLDPNELACGLTKSSKKYTYLTANLWHKKSDRWMVDWVPLIIFMDGVSQTNGTNISWYTCPIPLFHKKCLTRSSMFALWHYCRMLLQWSWSMQWRSLQCRRKYYSLQMGFFALVTTQYRLNSAVRLVWTVISSAVLVTFEVQKNIRDPTVDTVWYLRLIHCVCYLEARSSFYYTSTTTTRSSFCFATTSHTHYNSLSATTSLLCTNATCFASINGLEALSNASSAPSPTAWSVPTSISPNTI